MSYNKQPLISVIMPVFNSKEYVNKAINSILNQTYPNFEFLIIDDKSTDRTAEILKGIHDERIRLFFNDENIGSLKSRNKLFKEANGDYITFQDADDWSSSNRFELQLDCFKNNSDLSVCGTFASYYDLKLNKILDKKLNVEDDTIKKMVVKNNQFCSASIMVKKEVLDEIGGYRDFFIVFGNYDYDWSSRLCQRFSSTNIPKFLYHVLITPFSNSRNIRDAKKLISSDIVQFLIKERNETGSDSLEKGNIQKLKKVEEELLLPFFRDKSLIFRRIADINWPLRDKKRYLSSTIKAVKNRPLQLKNWKYLFHAIYRILWVVLISKSRQRNSF